MMAEKYPEIQVPLKKNDTGNGHVESGGEPDPPWKCREGNCRKWIIAVGVVFSSLLVISVLAVWPCKCPSADLGPPAGPACPDSWVGFRGKCYYFSEDEGNWTSSQTHCSALNASLAGIDTRQDMGFMVRHKGTFDHWIGLRRDLGQPWKWANGTEFNNLFLIGGGGGGDCAYLKQGEVSSSQCSGIKFWICSKPDVFRGKADCSGRGW